MFGFCCLNRMLEFVLIGNEFTCRSVWFFLGFFLKLCWVWSSVAFTLLLMLDTSGVLLNGLVLSESSPSWLRGSQDIFQPWMNSRNCLVIAIWQVSCIGFVELYLSVCGFTFSRRLEGTPFQISGKLSLHSSLLLGVLPHKFQQPQPSQVPTFVSSSQWVS